MAIKTPENGMLDQRCTEIKILIVLYLTFIVQKSAFIAHGHNNEDSR